MTHPQREREREKRERYTPDLGAVQVSVAPTDGDVSHDADDEDKIEVHRDRLLRQEPLWRT